MANLNSSPIRDGRRSNNEYDWIFVFKISRDHGKRSITFTMDHEGLNNLSDQCP